MRSLLFVEALTMAALALHLGCGSSVNTPNGLGETGGGSDVSTTGPSTAATMSSTSTTAVAGTGGFMAVSSSNNGDSSSSGTGAGGMGGADVGTASSSSSVAGTGGGSVVCGPPGGMCNAPGQCQSGYVYYQQIPDNPIPPSGGVVVDGTYIVTKILQFTGPGGAGGPLADPGIKETLVFANGNVTFNALTKVQGQPQMPMFGAATYSTAGTQMTTANTCPMAGMPAIADYSASPTEIRVDLMLNGIVYETVVSKIE